MLFRSGRDREALLVAWLNELVARTEIDHVLYRDVAIDDVTATRLDARIRGVPFSETRTAVKASSAWRFAARFPGSSERPAIFWLR